MVRPARSAMPALTVVTHARSVMPAVAVVRPTRSAMPEVAVVIHVLANTVTPAVTATGNACALAVVPPAVVTPTLGAMGAHALFCGVFFWISLLDLSGPDPRKHELVRLVHSGALPRNTLRHRFEHHMSTDRYLTWMRVAASCSHPMHLRAFAEQACVP